MKAEYVNPFLQAASLVFKQLLQLELIRGKTVVKNTLAPRQEIAIYIDVSGPVNGRVIYSLTPDGARKIYERLGGAPESFDQEYRDVLGEIANMITGNALNIFLSRNEFLDVSVPVVIDTRTTPFPARNETTLGLNMYSPLGLIDINISLREAA
jgi:chemotaxis protein CheX